MNKHYMARLNMVEGRFKRFWQVFVAKGGIEWSLAVALVLGALYGFYWLIVLCVEVTA